MAQSSIKFRKPLFKTLAKIHVQHLNDLKSKFKKKKEKKICFFWTVLRVRPRAPDIIIVGFTFIKQLLKKEHTNLYANIMIDSLDSDVS